MQIPSNVIIPVSQLGSRAQDMTATNAFADSVLPENVNGHQVAPPYLQSLWHVGDGHRYGQVLLTSLGTTI
jgi:hypothetical protein